MRKYARARNFEANSPENAQVNQQTAACRPTFFCRAERIEDAKKMFYKFT